MNLDYDRLQKNAKKAASSAALSFEKHASSTLRDDLRSSMVALLDPEEVVIQWGDNDDDNDDDDDDDDDVEQPLSSSSYPHDSATNRNTRKAKTQKQEMTRKSKKKSSPNPLYHWKQLDQIALSYSRSTLPPRGLPLADDEEAAAAEEEIEYSRERFADRSLEEGSHMSVKRLNRSALKGYQDSGTAAAAFILECKFLSNLPRHPNIAQIYAMHSHGCRAPFLADDDDEEEDVNNTHTATTRRAPDSIPSCFFSIVDSISETLMQRFDRWRHKESYSDEHVFQHHEGVQERANKISQRLDVVLDVVSALAFLANRRVVYILHPSKVGFDTKHQRIKLFDFGQAREAGKAPFYDFPGAGSREDMHRRVYLAPELLSDSAAIHTQITCQVDVYASGMLLWETLTLHTPFSGWSKEMHHTKAVLGKDRPYLNPTWPSSLRRLLLDCWLPSNTSRPDMANVCRRLETSLLNFQEEFKGIDRTEEHERQNKHITPSGASREDSASQSKSRKIKYQKQQPATVTETDDENDKSVKSKGSTRSRQSVRSRGSVKSRESIRSRESVRSKESSKSGPSTDSEAATPTATTTAITTTSKEKAPRDSARSKVSGSTKKSERSQSRSIDPEQRSVDRKLSNSAHIPGPTYSNAPTTAHRPRRSASAIHVPPEPVRQQHRSESPPLRRKLSRTTSVAEKDKSSKSVGRHSTRTPRESSTPSSSRSTRSVSDERNGLVSGAAGGEPSSSRSVSKESLKTSTRSMKPGSTRTAGKEEKKPSSRKLKATEAKRESDPAPVTASTPQKPSSGSSLARKESPRRSSRRRISSERVLVVSQGDRNTSPSSVGGSRGVRRTGSASGSSPHQTPRSRRGVSPFDADNSGRTDSGATTSSTPTPTRSTNRGVLRSKSMSMAVPSKPRSSNSSTSEVIASSAVPSKARSSSQTKAAQAGTSSTLPSKPRSSSQSKSNDGKPRRERTVPTSSKTTLLELAAREPQVGGEGKSEGTAAESFLRAQYRRSLQLATKQET